MFLVAWTLHIFVFLGGTFRAKRADFENYVLAIIQKFRLGNNSNQHHR